MSGLARERVAGAPTSVRSTAITPTPSATLLPTLANRSRMRAAAKRLEAAAPFAPLTMTGQLIGSLQWSAPEQPPRRSRGGGRADRRLRAERDLLASTRRDVSLPGRRRRQSRAGADQLGGTLLRAARLDRYARAPTPRPPLAPQENRKAAGNAQSPHGHPRRNQGNSGSNQENSGGIVDGVAWHPREFVADLSNLAVVELFPSVSERGQSGCIVVSSSDHERMPRN